MIVLEMFSFIGAVIFRVLWSVFWTGVFATLSIIGLVSFFIFMIRVVMTYV